MLVTITGTVITDWVRTGSVELWLWAREPYMASDGTMVQSASPLQNSKNAVNVRKVTCTVDAGAKTLTIPTIANIFSTTDALDNPYVRLSAAFFTPTGSKIKPFQSFDDFQLPALATQTWEDIRTFNNATIRFLDTTVFTRTESDNRYARTSDIENLVPDSRQILTTAPLTGGGDLSATRTFAIPKATTLVDGYLAAADWTIFNNKLDASAPLVAPVSIGSVGVATLNLGELPIALVGQPFNTPHRLGMADGSTVARITDRSPSFVSERFEQTVGAGISVGHVMSTNRYTGSAAVASYNLYMNATSGDTAGPVDSEIAAGYFVGANSVGGTTIVKTLIVEADQISTVAKLATCLELDVINASGATAQPITTTIPGGSTAAIFISPQASGAGSAKVSAGIIFQQGTAPILTGIGAVGAAIDVGRPFIDGRFMTQGQVMRLPNLSMNAEGMIYGRNNADSADIALLGVTAADRVSVPSVLHVNNTSAVSMIVENTALGVVNSFIEFLTGGSLRAHFGYFGGVGFAVLDAAGAKITSAVLDIVGTVANYTALSPSITTAPVIYGADGTDANIGVTVKTKGSGDLLLDPSTGNIKLGKALVALGGGAGATLGTIGGSGPATAGQNTWAQFKDSGGNLCWVPIWK